MKTVFMFSGQGSHYYQMGRKLFNNSNTFKESMYELDEVVTSTQGVSIIDQLYNSKHRLSDPLLSLELTHPAIFMVEYALIKVLASKGITPDYVLGSSLGEFVSMVLSDMLSVEEALTLVIQQAKAIKNNCDSGKMVAVLHDLKVYNNTSGLNSNCSLASINSPSQFVVAGSKNKTALVIEFLKENDILYQELMVEYGFHSSSIDSAEDVYKTILTERKLNRPKIPFVSGVMGRNLSQFPTNYLWDIVRKPVLFSSAIETLEKQVVKDEKLMYVDLGPSGSLANLIKYNVKDSVRSKGFQTMSPFQQELKKLEEIEDYFNANRKKLFSQTKSEQPIAYVFPGQGSQRRGMAQELFDSFPELTNQASELLGYSIQELCVHDPERKLSLTQYTQPALFTVNAMSYLKLIEEKNIRPSFVAGHSLGEYNALFAAEVFDFRTGLELVRKRGALMAEMQGGGMAAVKGLSIEEIQQVIEKHSLSEIDIANYNSQNQIVLSGPTKMITQSGRYFEEAGATLYFPLNVSGAFHSRYMLPAKEEFEQFIQQFEFLAPKIPVVSNVTASFYSSAIAKTLLADQLVKPVRWTECVTFFIAQGTTSFKEVGPGDVLTKLVWRIEQDAQELAM